MNKGKVILKRVFACLTAFFLLADIAGCGKGETEKGLPEKTDNLVVYVGPYYQKFLNAAVYRFSLAYPDVNVEVRDFGDTSDPQNEENYMEVLKSDLAAGVGPDLILFSSYEFDDIQKTAESGAFQDLSGYIAGDADFSLDNFNSGVMEAGITDGQRLFVPLSYSVDILMTTQEVLAGAGQNIPTTLQDLYQQMVDFGQTYRDDTERFFTQDYYLFQNLLRSSRLSLVDYDAKEVTVDNEDFRSFMEAYKELYEMDWKRSEDGIYATDQNVYYAGEDVGLVQSGKVLYIHEQDQHSFVESYAGLLYDQTPVYTAFPSVAGTPVASMDMGAAVNSNGENKANAYYLLKIMLSDIMQSYGCGILNGCYPFDLPVLNGILKDNMKKENNFKVGTGNETPYGITMYASIPDETLDQYVSLVSDVTCSYVSGPVQNFVWDEMQPYFEGQKSYEECLASLINKLELYINE